LKTNSKDKKQSPLVLGAILVLLLTVPPILLLKAWTPYIQPLTFSHQEKHFFSSIADQLNRGVTTIPVKGLTDFDWDLVCLFYGYDIPPAIETLHSHGVKRLDKHQEKDIRAIEKESDIRMLVFSLGGEVQTIVYHTGSSLQVSQYTVSMHAGDESCIGKPVAVFQLKSDGRLPINHKHLTLTTEE